MIFCYNLSQDGSLIKMLLHAEINTRCGGLPGQWCSFRHVKQANATFTFNMKLESNMASQSCIMAPPVSIQVPQFQENMREKRPHGLHRISP